MSSALRLFYALPLKQETLEALTLAQQRMRRIAEQVRLRLRWIDPANLHLTLKFLGTLDAGLCPELQRLLATVTAGQRAIAASIEAVSAFPTQRRTRVVVAETGDPDHQIAHLAQLLETGSKPWGVERERRPFRAHVTLARAKVPSDTRTLLKSAHLERISAPLDEVRLYSSELRPTGAVYHCVGAAKLTG